MGSGDLVQTDVETLLSFEPQDDPNGIAIVDHIERRRCTLETAHSVDPRTASVDSFYFPVDQGVSITTDRVTLPHTVAVCLRNHAGFMIDELTQGDSRDFPSDLYSIELSAPIKLYVVIEAAPSVAVTTDEVTISFDTPVKVLIGARSHHKHPAATIETTADPTDMMEAVSYLSSALKTTTVERSYPTLRGHPPTIELGDRHRIPDVLQRPETGVRIELPTDREHVFTASTLAYYLGAKMVPAERARLVTDSGFVHELETQSRGFEEEVERVLKQVFFLDCITRTEGFYPVNLHERNAIEDRVDLNFEYLYDQPIGRQLTEYLKVPFSILESNLPQWKLTAYTTPEAKKVEMVPFLVNDLAVIRTANPMVHGSLETRQRSGNNDLRNSSFTRSRQLRSSDPSPNEPRLVDLDKSDSLEQTWLGEGAPMAASKAMIEAFKNRLFRNPSQGDIDITVVCNDPEMGSERDVADQIYGSREKLPFDVSIKKEVTTAELENVLASEIDFFHYIGHIEPRGFECKDGYFDAGSLDQSGVDAFFLNACSSYNQGLRLIKAGSICGIVTLQEVINSGAERIGKILTRLLNAGFPMRASINIAKQQSIMGGHYLVVGDGSHDIVQTQSGNPTLGKVERNCDGYSIKYYSYPTSDKGMGTIHYPYIGDNNEYYLISGENDTFQIDEKQLRDYLQIENSLNEIFGELKWSSEIDINSEI